MTIHRLTSNRRTVCGLTVPSIITLEPNRTWWEDGDTVGAEKQCTDGCWAVGTKVSVVPVPTGPRPEPLQRFNAMAKTRHGQEKVGTAIVNRDKSIVVHLNMLPVDGKLVLVPA